MPCTAHCFIKILTLGNIIASIKMLPYSGEKKPLRELMMTIQSKRELLKVMHPRYLKANKTQKTQILDEFVAATGYHRKYATSILKRGPRPPRLKKKAGRKKTYQGEVIKTLEHIWEICGRICSKRLKPFLPEIVTVLERCNEIQMLPDTKKNFFCR